MKISISFQKSFTVVEQLTYSRIFTTCTKSIRRCFSTFCWDNCTMATSVFCSIHTNKIIYTKKDHNEVIKEQQLRLTHIASSKEWNLFLQKILRGVEPGFFKKRFSIKATGGNIIIASIYPPSSSTNIKNPFKQSRIIL